MRIVILFFLLETNAHAYLDLGTISMIVNGIVGLIVTVLIYFFDLIDKIKNLISKILQKIKNLFKRIKR